MRRGLIWTIGSVFLLSFSFVAVAQQKEEAHFSVVTAAFDAKGDFGIIRVTVKNEGELPGTATVTVRRELSRCAEVDEEYCRNHPADPGTTCEPPCLRWETKELGTDTQVTGTIASCKESVVEIRVPNEPAYAEIKVSPGGTLGFGLEISGR